MLTDPIADNRQMIIDAAERCFERNGIAQTNMADIAREAGLSRRTVYRTFADRSELLLAIVDHHIRLLNRHLNGQLGQFDTLEQALIDGIIYTVRISKSDRLFNALVVKSTDRNIESLIIDANDDIRELFTRSWQPLIEKARKSGELMSPLSDERLVEGIRNFVALLIVRSGQSEEEQKQFLQDFVVPAVFGRKADVEPANK